MLKFFCGRRMQSICAVTIVFAPLFATAGTAQAQNTDKPLRRLEFAYSVDYVRHGETYYNGIGTVGSGVSSLDASTGRQGTLYVDVLSRSRDRSLVVRVQEWIKEQPRPGQAYTCAVYPEGRVLCPASDGISDVDNEVLRYVGDGFFDDQLVDDKGHWKRNFSVDRVNVSSDFVISGSVDAPVISVNEETNVKGLSVTLPDWRVSTHFTYDRPHEVLDSLHDVGTTSSRGAASLQVTMDVQLKKDSMFPPQPGP